MTDTTPTPAASGGTDDQGLREFVSRMKRLPPDAARVLHENLWDLYLDADLPTPPASAPGGEVGEMAPRWSHFRFGMSRAYAGEWVSHADHLAAVRRAAEQARECCSCGDTTETDRYCSQCHHGLIDVKAEQARNEVRAIPGFAMPPEGVMEQVYAARSSPAPREALRDILRRLLPNLLLNDNECGDIVSAVLRAAVAAMPAVFSDGKDTGTVRIEDEVWASGISAAVRRAAEQGRERIACGQCHPDDAQNDRLLAANARVAGDSGEGGCGAAGIWTSMFRCADCGRWFHRQCLYSHFAAHAALADDEGRGT